VTTAPTRLVVVYGAVPAAELLRTEAARFHQVRAAQIVILHECPRCGSDAHGRPYLPATAAVRVPAHVSLARAGDLSVVAVTDAGPVGVDVEAEGAAEFAGFDAVGLHPGERGATPADRTRTWVRKEALLKAHGLGLAVDPSDVSIDDHGLVAWGSSHRSPGPVWLRDLVVPGHVVAVAVLPPADRTRVTGVVGAVEPGKPQQRLLHARDLGVAGLSVTVRPASN
jgi:4'-phosphopantetheinyl transferase